MAQPAPVRVCFVCSGNICRSPMAEVVLRELVRRAGAEGRVEVDSAGTGDWHVGSAADRRALRVLAAAGYDGASHRARQFDAGWLADRDLVIALDRGHERAVRLLVDAAARRSRTARMPEVRLLRSFDLSASPDDLDVADPYYGDEAGFRLVLRQVETACEALLEHLLAGERAPARTT